MSDTPDKKDTPASESADSTEKKSPWFVTPMGDKQDDKQDKTKLQPEQSEQSEKPEEGKEADADRPEKSRPAATAPNPPATAPKPAATAPKPAPKAPKPAPTASTSKPESTSKPNPFAGGSSITFDDDSKANKVSKPMLVVDGLAAAVAIAFTVLILQDVLPFL